jgi:hypothetical protein
MQVHWVKNTNNTDQWFDLLKLDLNSSYFNNAEGVYVIWYTAPNQAKAIRVGQGHIGSRLREHRGNPEITKYAQYGALKVTWALVSPEYRDGIEVFLYNTYLPLVGTRAPAVTPIEVNLL